jgi:hypothetical protein
MATIDSAPKARKLAQAVLVDLRREHADLIAAGGDLGEVLAEGQALYRSRVVPELHALFETVLLEAAVRGP